jgi:hypothetical protein
LSWDSDPESPALPIAGVQGVRVGVQFENVDRNCGAV